MKQSRIISFVMLVIMLFAMAIPTMAAENEITPRYNNTSTTQAVFVIRDDGEAIISYTCLGYEGITTRIVVETKIQKNMYNSTLIIHHFCATIKKKTKKGVLL